MNKIRSRLLDYSNTNFYEEFNNNFMKSNHKSNLTSIMLDNYMFLFFIYELKC